MNRLDQFSCNQWSCSSEADVKEKDTAQGIVSGRVVSPVSGEPFGVNLEDFTPDPVTGKKDQKEIGISSRAVALDSNTREAAKRKLKQDITDAEGVGFMVTSEASSPGSLKKFRVNPRMNTAICTEKQVELIKKVFDDRIYELKEDEFKNVIDYISPEIFRTYIPEACLESPAFIKKLVGNGFPINFPKNKLTKDILLTVSKGIDYGYLFDQLPDELKEDLDFLIEYSNRKGIPSGTPPELAVYIYEHLDITAKIKSLNKLPDSFKNKNDDLYDELIHSGMIELKDLPESVKSRNKEYCLSQLSRGLCGLSEIPIHFMTKESILDSIKGKHYRRNLFFIFVSKYNVFTEDPVFFEEILVKSVAVELEDIDVPLGFCADRVFYFASERYKSDEKTLGLLLKKLVNANPFFLIYTKDLNDKLLQDLIDTAKYSLLKSLRSIPEVSQGFTIEHLDIFFEKINADNDFKTHILSIVYPYFPCQKRSKLPDEILQEQDKIVLKSEPFDSGHDHFISRKLRPTNPRIVLDYIERNKHFLKFIDKGYLEQCSADSTIRQRLIHILAQRLVADKQLLSRYWNECLPRQLLVDTLNFLKDPALFLKLDSSDKLSEPVNPLHFQLSNTEAFRLVVGAHAVGPQPADVASSLQLQSEFARASETEFQWVDPDEHPLSLFKEEGIIVGGRTLAIPNGKEVDYYKFHRVGESVSTLAQEGIMHQFIAESDRFKSQKPRFGQYLVVMEKDLPDSIRGFTDRLQVSYVNGKRAFLVYHFKATNNYGKYAHTADSTNTPYATAERGLLNGIHDIGVLNGQFGVMPTSTIPAFHFTGRRWVFLSPLLGNSTYFAFPLPGKFERWIEAIERPDFGWDGLRDWGDVEFYGSMTSGLGAKDSKTWGYTPEVIQRLSFANALCENLLAAVLLRSRLRRDSQDYYYQNQQAVKETENFIEQLLNEYLSGFLAKEKELQPKSRLQEFMGLDDTKYSSWLTRSAQEILYWTALQPYEVTDPNTLNPDREYYSEHLKKTGHLDKTLYPTTLYPSEAQKKFPSNFVLANGQVNLGADNAALPLVALTRGITRYVCNTLFSRRLIHRG